MTTRTVPDCCICDPAVCAADTTGHTCETRGCASCLDGCPAPDGTCCPPVRDGDLDELAAWYQAQPAAAVIRDVLRRDTDLIAAREGNKP